MRVSTTGVPKDIPLCLLFKVVPDAGAGVEGAPCRADSEATARSEEEKQRLGNGKAHVQAVGKPAKLAPSRVVARLEAVHWVELCGDNPRRGHEQVGFARVKRSIRWRAQ